LSAMRLHLHHHTEYRYQTPVVMAQHMAHLQPVDRPSQQVVSHALHIDPLPAWQQHRIDSFGNHCTHFALQSPHPCLNVHAHSVVDTQPTMPLPDSEPWEHLWQRLQFQRHMAPETHAEYACASPLAPSHPRLADYAAGSFPEGRPWLAACQDLMTRIHHDFRYVTGSSDIHTSVLQTLQQRQGVCQDFAHLMIGCLRSLGLPARYVSGYLLTQPPPGQARLLGADASHAWVTVPHQGQWHDFDPTNLRSGTHSPGEDYVTLALGRDFGDVSPLRGVIQGGGQHSLSVAVSVVPEDEHLVFQPFAVTPPLGTPGSMAS